MEAPPLLALALRLNAFLALITAALVVSLLSPGQWSDKIGRVASAFGATAGSIGIVIALAAIIGISMLESGAADRIVRWFLDALGEERVSIALRVALCSRFPFSSILSSTSRSPWLGRRAGAPGATTSSTSWSLLRGRS